MPQNYQWMPADPEIVHDSPTGSDQVIPPGFVRQTAWASPAQNPPEARPPDLQGVYIGPIPPAPDTPNWRPIVWRWADTWRRESIQRVMTSGGFPAYHMELSQGDTASPGTTGDHPRAELFSLDPSELRRERPAAPGSLGSLSDGDEYWATFAIFIPSNFPSNHDWATLFQRKIDNRFFKDNFLTWFSINVHKTRVDASIPGFPAFPGSPGGADDDVRICALGDIAGQWAQFTVHEKLSKDANGAADVTLKVAHNPAETKVEVADARKTFPPGDVKGHFQYGYYRENRPAPNEKVGPGTGVVYYTPLMLSKTGANVPRLP